MLTVELTDNDSWQLLIQMADNLGYDDMKSGRNNQGQGEGRI
jgi:hypothetical protein